MGITKKRLWRAQGFDLSVLNDVDQSECSEAASRRSEAKRSEAKRLPPDFCGVHMETGRFIYPLVI